MTCTGDPGTKIRGRRAISCLQNRYLVPILLYLVLKGSSMTKPPVISPAYAEMNRRLHEDKPEYGVGATFDAPTILALCRQNGFSSVLDFGCGKGALKQALATAAPEITVLEFDPAVPGKDTLPTQPFDLLVALDVMEHIEP